MKRTDVHVLTEALALAIIAPWLFKLASDPCLSERQRNTALMFALGTVVVDGALLASYLRKRIA